MKKLLIGVILIVFVIFAASQITKNRETSSDTVASSSAPVPTAALSMNADRARNAEDEPGNWLLHGRTYSEQRFSTLNNVNENTVKDLGLAWYFETGAKSGLEATPVVVDGVMYFTGSWSEVFAVDARTGNMLWRNDLNVDKNRGKYACCDVVNRGVAVWKGKVYVGTIDGRLVALDAASGKIIWDNLTIDLSRPYSITGAPRIVKDKVIIGNGGAEYGVRGYITAYDTETGDQKWRFYTVPGNPADGFESPAMEMAAKTWGGGPWWEVGGGGTVWDSMAYDADLDLLYVGVGNGSPWNRYIRSPAGGDNLFLSSIVAIEPDTGTYVWHYQTTPSEGWDYTATQHMILAELEIDGKERKVIMQAPKNGFFYVIDRETGEFISANNYVPVSWASHIDPETGRPVITDNNYKDKPVVQFPSPLGGHNWQPMCYHRETGYVYIPSRELSFLYSHEEDFEYEPGHWNVGIPVMKDIFVPTWIDADVIKKLGAASTRGYLQAWDPIKQERVWRVEHKGPWNGGLLCTAGNLVFQGNGQAEIVAYTADTGKRVWSYKTQSGIIAAPITFAVDGEQYVSVLAGWGGSVGLSFAMISNSPEKTYRKGRLLTFKLGAVNSLPDYENAKVLPEPPPMTASGDTEHKGNKLYHHNCVYCHGPGAVSAPNLKDLRYMDASAHEQFLAIVLGGIHKDEGMPGYSDLLSVEEAEAIHAYLIKAGHSALAEENANKTWVDFKGTVYDILGSIVSFFTGIITWLLKAA